MQGICTLATCGQVFEARREDARYCSAACRAKASRARRQEDEAREEVGGGKTAVEALRVAPPAAPVAERAAGPTREAAAGSARRAVGIGASPDATRRPEDASAARAARGADARKPGRRADRDIQRALAAAPRMDPHLGRGRTGERRADRTATEPHAHAAHASGPCADRDVAQAHADAYAHATEAHATEAHAGEAHTTEAHDAQPGASEWQVADPHGSRAYGSEAHGSSARLPEPHVPARQPPPSSPQVATPGTPPRWPAIPSPLPPKRTPHAGEADPAVPRGSERHATPPPSSEPPATLRAPPRRPTATPPHPPDGEPHGPAMHSPTGAAPMPAAPRAPALPATPPRVPAPSEPPTPDVHAAVAELAERLQELQNRFADAEGDLYDLLRMPDALEALTREVDTLSKAPINPDAVQPLLQRALAEALKPLERRLARLEQAARAPTAPAPMRDEGARLDQLDRLVRTNQEAAEKAETHLRRQVEALQATAAGLSRSVRALTERLDEVDAELTVVATALNTALTERAD